jgi:hypothetical protein
LRARKERRHHPELGKSGNCDERVEAAQAFSVSPSISSAARAQLMLDLNIMLPAMEHQQQYSSASMIVCHFCVNFLISTFMTGSDLKS